jgi:hypothetical protein
VFAANFTLNESQIDPRNKVDFVSLRSTEESDTTVGEAKDVSKASFALPPFFFVFFG